MLVDRTAETRVTDDTLNLDSVKDRFDAGHYLSPHSDIVALLVFEHQMHMINLLTRMGWDARMLASAGRPDATAILERSAEELVDYLLFADEMPLPSAVRGTSGFADVFAAQGPKDSGGRSLRELDLKTRLLRYPAGRRSPRDCRDPPRHEKGSARLFPIACGDDAHRR